MTLTFLTSDGFRKLNDEQKEQKEIFYFYGFCVFRVNAIEDVFIKGLEAYKFSLIPSIEKTKIQKQQWDKFQKHVRENATLGILIREYKDVYNTKLMIGFDELLEDLLKTRNKIVHAYMKININQLDDSASRIEIYEDLQYVHEVVTKVEKFIEEGNWIWTKKYPKAGYRFRNN